MPGDGVFPVVLSPHFPAELIDRVAAVSSRVRPIALTSVEVVPEQARDAAVLAWWDARRGELATLRAALPRLRWVQSPVAGVGDQRLHEILGPEVTLTSAAGVYADLVAEHALTLMLALYRRLPELLAQQHRGEWHRLDTRSLTGQTLGVIGAGGIGRATARLARPFGMRTIGTSRGGAALPEFDEIVPSSAFLDLLARADVVVVAAPSTPETRGLIDRRALAAMRPHAILINVARGPLVVTGDLLEALREGRIGGAGLDVTDPEPLPVDHPLWRAPNTIITPHHGNPDGASAVPAVERFCENLGRFLAGEPLIAVVDAVRGY